MLIVPEADALTVEARIAPQEIDQVAAGQAATLRFSAFNQRTTPELNGVVSRVSADLSTDQRTGAAYYTGEDRPAGERDRALERAAAPARNAGRELHQDRRAHDPLLRRKAVHGSGNPRLQGPVSPPAGEPIKSARVPSP